MHTAALSQGIGICLCYDVTTTVIINITENIYQLWRLIDKDNLSMQWLLAIQCQNTAGKSYTFLQQ